MIGHINIRMDKLEDLDAITFTHFLSELVLQDHVGFATYQSQHTIDLVITTETTEVRSGFTLLDHASIIAVLMVEKCNKIKIEVSFRKIKSINPEEFKCDLAKFSKTFVSLDEPLDRLVHEYNTTLTDILNKHAPLKKRQ